MVTFTVINSGMKFTDYRGATIYAYDDLKNSSYMCAYIVTFCHLHSNF